MNSLLKKWPGPLHGCGLKTSSSLAQDSSQFAKVKTTVTIGRKGTAGERGMLRSVRLTPAGSAIA
jgi:hypothetical protein